MSHAIPSVATTEAGKEEFESEMDFVLFAEPTGQKHSYRSSKFDSQSFLIAV